MENGHRLSEITEKRRAKKYYTLEQIELFSKEIPAGFSDNEKADLIEINMISQLSLQDAKNLVKKYRQ